MSKGPLGMKNALLDTYLKYLNTPFSLRYDALTEERESLLEEPGRIFQEPLIEYLPGYRKSGLNVKDLSSVLGLSGTAGEFLQTGLFPEMSDIDLFTHQVEASKLATKPLKDGGKHVVVTSGTGSGKTECFLIPVISRLLKESRNWEPPEGSPKYWWKTGTNYIPKREHENRPVAMRALFLYPLNALVEDQMKKLRKTLDSEYAESWLDSNRGGNRFYFGAYFGGTPYPGEKNKDRISDLKEYLSDMNEEREALPEVERDLLSDPEGAEMVARWDMQEHPPDILVTNYSMLNIMMMRSIESEIFEKTRDWLQSDGDNTFTLVLDELHTYRGTPGTEVALVLRSFLDRLGLSPDSSQLRIIATSASLEDNEEGREFLADFFGCSPNKFEVVSGEPKEPSGDEPSNLSSDTVRKFSEFEEKAQKDSVDEALDFLRKNLKSETRSSKKGLSKKLAEMGIPKRLTRASRGGKNSLATSVSDISDHAFSKSEKGNLSRLQLKKAVSGITLACAELNHLQESGSLLPARVHLFFRNLTGIWACLNPECSEIKIQGERPAGRVYTEPKISCECGSRILKLYYCQTCGEVFFGGYRNPARDVGEGFYLTPDFPELENLPNPKSLKKNLNEYTVFWPTRDKEPDKKKYSLLGGERVQWEIGWLDPESALVNRDPKNGMRGWYLKAVGDPQEDIKAVPKYCPNCGDRWQHQFGKDGKFISPVRGLDPAFTKVAQVLGDDLLVEGGEDTSRRKLVSFSDSRQGAAKLSRDMEFDHYLDLLRNLVLHHCQTASQSRKLEAYKKTLEDEDVKPQEEKLARQFENENPQVALAVQKRQSGLDLTAGQKQSIKEIEKRRNEGTPLTGIWTSIERSLVELGVNPAGIKKWAHEEDENGRKMWLSAYNGIEEGDVTLNTGADPDVKDLRKGIKNYMINKGIQQIFAGRNRSLENLGFGYITFDAEDRKIAGLDEETSRQIADASIRILGQGRRILYRQENIPYESLEYQRGEKSEPPRELADYLEKVSEVHDCDFKRLKEGLEDWLEGSKAVDDYRIDEEGLLLKKAENDEYWECPKCRRRHLHPAGGVCTDCYEELSKVNESPRINQENYYASLAIDDRTSKSLHCEELTGQTDKIDFSRRLRWFQDICKENENEVVRPIDVMNVTTTMEAGVDIGQLKMVMLANMPPERFNYQQRVGRCGRRRKGLSYVLTFCKGRSHDDYYFNNLEAMTSDPPPNPYLDLERKRIVKRVLSSEVLRRAFNETRLGSKPSDTDSVHGEFGPSKEWTEKRDRIGGWIEENPEEVRDIVETLTVGASGVKEAREDLIEYVREEEGLLCDVDEAVENSAEEYLSQALAWEGVLPIFGFPTRVRNLYLDRPKMQKGKWIEESIDRPLKIAIGEFAPGSEIVRDKNTHLPIGIADYVPGRVRNQKAAVLSDNLFGNEEEVSYCDRCKTLHPEPKDECSICGLPRTKSEGDHRLMTLSYPSGFRTNYSPKEPKPGEASRTFTSSAKVHIPPLDPESAKNILGARLWLKSGKFHYINDNNGNMFDLVKVPREGWIDERYLDKINRKETAESAETIERALAVKKSSECIVVEPADLDPEITLNILNIGVRSALYSFGFMLQRAVATYLDISQKELNVGITPIGISEFIKGRIYLADSHENGAGYARHLSERDNFSTVLEDILQGRDSKFLAGMRNHFEGSAECDTSCYNCIRSYQNRRYHPLLDWRLAFDTAILMSDERSLEPVSDNWLKAVSKGMSSLGPQFEELELSGIPGVRHKRSDNIAIFSHPFFSRDENKMPTRVAEAQIEAERISTGSIVHRSYFDIVHRPWKVASDVVSK